MPIFRYKATNSGGKMVSDTITASSRNDAIDALIAQGLSPSHVQEDAGADQPVHRFPAD